VKKPKIIAIAMNVQTVLNVKLNKCHEMINCYKVKK